MKKINLVLLSALFILAQSCRNEPKDPNAGNASAHTLSNAEIRLVCQEAKDPNQDTGAPQNEVFLYLADSKVKIADILACGTIAPADYAQHQIPEDAIVAVGGWWAGAGDYFYVVKEGENFVVKQGAMFEEKEDNSYDYKTVMTFSAAGEEVF